MALDEWLGTPGLRTLMGFEILPPVRAMSMEFLMPLTWDDELSIKVSVAKLGVHSFTFLVEGFIVNGPLSFVAKCHSCMCLAGNQRSCSRSRAAESASFITRWKDVRPGMRNRGHSGTSGSDHGKKRTHSCVSFVLYRLPVGRRYRLHKPNAIVRLKEPNPLPLSYPVHQQRVVQVVHSACQRPLLFRDFQSDGHGADCLGSSPAPRWRP